jgi:signal transduction histidine kinase
MMSDWQERNIDLSQRILDLTLFETKANKALRCHVLPLQYQQSGISLNHELCFDVNTCLPKVINAVQKRFPKHKPIDLLIADVPLTAHNQLALSKVFFNVLLNAMQASQPLQAVSVCVYKQNHSINVVIQDQGSGISENNLQQVFSPFYTTRNGREGTGLGLAISRQIISDCDGSIVLQSALGVGTKCKLQLPLSGWYSH